MNEDHLDGQSAKEMFQKHEGLIYSDYVVLPDKNFSESAQINLSSRLSKNIRVGLPFVSSPMDTVTESKLAIALALVGGVGVIHYNLDIETQTEMIAKVKRFRNGFIYDPIVLSPEHRICDIDRIKKQYGFSGIPITIDGKKNSQVVGVITNRDIDFEDDRNKKISQVMTTKLITGKYKDLDLRAAYEVLKKSKKGKLIIINEKNELMGLVSRSDLMKRKNFPFATTDSKGNLTVGAAISSYESSRERVAELVRVGVDFLVIDSAQGYSTHQIEMLEWLKKSFPDVDVIAGNSVTRKQAVALIKAGCDGLRIGMGPGSICITQDVLSVGRAQATAVYNVAEVAHQYDVPVIADGGIQSIGDIFKSLSIGADTVMMGAMFAGTQESPGEYFFENGLRVKHYRGMASVEALERGGEMRYYDKKQDLKFAQGVSGTVADRGSIYDLVPYLEHGLRLSLQYCGIQSIEDLHTKMCDGSLRLERRTVGAQKQGSVHSLQAFQEPFFFTT